MIVEFSVLDTPYFRIEHLFDNTENLRLVDDFVAGNDA